MANEPASSPVKQAESAVSNAASAAGAAAESGIVSFVKHNALVIGIVLVVAVVVLAFVVL